MRTAALQFLVIIAVFFLTWFALSRINWVSVFKVEQVVISTEKKLGAMLWDMFSRKEKEVYSATVNRSVDSLVSHLCRSNGINRSKIKLHILQKDEINAFALPDNHLVIYSGLISAAENEAELLGVIGHEIAHMEKGHVMKKLIKEIGLSVLISGTSGNGGPVVIQEAARLLSSAAYDRKLETEADITSVEYLLNADIDPEPFAGFLYRLSSGQNDLPGQEWISTHPDSKIRAEKVIDYVKDRQVNVKPVLSPDSWKKIKERLEDTF